MAGPNSPYSNLDQRQIFQRVFNEATDKLRVDIGATLSLDGDIVVDVNQSSDSIRIGDGTNLISSTNDSGTFGFNTHITNSSLPVIGTITANQGTAGLAAWKIDGSAVTQPVSGTITANIGTTNGLALNSSLTTINSTLGTPFQSGGSIGNTSFVATQATGTNLHTVVDSGSVTISSSALPTGASTSALQTTGNTSLSSIDSKIPSSLTVSSTRLLVDGSGVTQPISGSVSISNFPATQPVSGTVAATQSGTWNVGTVSTITNVVHVDDNSSSLTVDNSGTFAVQAAQSGNWSSRTLDGSGNSISSTSSKIHTYQPDKTILNQNITALNQIVSLDVSGMGSIYTQIEGTFTATLSFEGTIDGSNWFTVYGISNGTGLNNQTSITIPDQVYFSGQGLQQFRIKCTAYTSGTAVVSIAANQSPSGVDEPINFNINAGFLPITGTIIANQGGPWATSIQSYEFTSINNSTTSNLAASATFTGTYDPLRNLNNLGAYNTIRVIVFADQPLTIQVQQSIDNINWDISDSFTTTASVGDSRSFLSTSNYYRIKVTNNGASTTTALRVKSIASTHSFPLPRTLTSSGGLKVTADPITFASAQHIIADSGTISTITNVVHVDDNSGSLTVDNGGTFAVQATIAAGATNIAKAEDVASADADVGVPAMAVRKATPGNTSGTDGDYEMLQMSAGRLWASSNIDQINGVTPLMGAGNGGTGSLRVNIASDQVAIPSSQSGAWTVTANAGTNLNTSALALDTSVTGLQLSQGSTTLGQKGELQQGAVTTSAPSYTTAQTSPISLTTAGGLRADLASIAGTTTSTGNGTVGAGVQRVAIASDNTAFSVNATLAAGSAVVGKVSIDQTTPGTTNLVALAANQSINNAQVNGATVVTSVTGVQDVMPRKRTSSTGLSPNYAANHITSKTTTTPTAATAYVSAIVIACSAAGTTWTMVIQNKEATPKILVPSFTLTVPTTGLPVILQFEEPILMTSGIDIITAGTTAGTVDVFVTYWQ